MKNKYNKMNKNSSKMNKYNSSKIIQIKKKYLINDSFMTCYNPK